jgi:hypothetical protein
MTEERRFHLSPPKLCLSMEAVDVARGQQSPGEVVT